ncbi:Zinc finger, GRF-type [Sesbania bispinosa]|nr:Zinc finger, GRF-type [Sesbania bispinosa]
MAGNSKSSSASGFSRKRCGCGDEVVVFTAGSKAKNPGKRFRRCPNWKDVNRSCGLFEWVEEDDKLGDLLGGGCCNSSEMLIETLKLKNSKLHMKLEKERTSSRLTKKLLVMAWVMLFFVCMWCLLKCHCGKKFGV